MMRTSSDGLNIIKAHEGLKLEAYRCPAGVLTIGYGHTGNVHPGEKITMEKAEEYLINDIRWAEDAVERVQPRLNQNQFDALVDFAYNVGEVAFRNSTLARMVSSDPDNPAIADEFLKWKYAAVHGKKQVLPGLLNRRRAEVGLYFRQS